MIDYSKSAKVHMLCKKTGNIAFILQVYGVHAGELMSVPNEIIHRLARKYPDHQSSPFMIEQQEVHETGKRIWFQVNRNNQTAEGLF